MWLASALGSILLTVVGCSNGGFAPGPPAYFVYVTNGVGAGSISAFSLNTSNGVLTPVPGSPFAAGANTTGITVDPTSRFLYVANFGDPSVGSYSISSTTGALTLITTTPTGAGPSTMDEDLLARFLFIPDLSLNKITVYNLDPNLGNPTTQVAGSPFAGGGQAAAAIVNAASTFLYVANGLGSLTTYSITSSSGVLNLVSTISAGTGPLSLNIDPSGNYIYVPDNGGTAVYGYSLNTSGGIPVSIGSFTAGNGPRDVTIHPSLNFVYVSNNGSGNISGFSMNSSNGNLTPLTTSPYGTGTNPKGITIDPTGRYVFCVNNGSTNLYVYSINQITGALTQVGSPYSVGQGNRIATVRILQPRYP